MIELRDNATSFRRKLAACIPSSKSSPTKHTSSEQEEYERGDFAGTTHGGAGKDQPAAEENKAEDRKHGGATAPDALKQRPSVLVCGVVSSGDEKMVAGRACVTDALFDQPGNLMAKAVIRIERKAALKCFLRRL